MTLPSHFTGDRTTLETVSAQQCRTVSLGNGTILCLVLGRYKFYADANDIGITPHLALEGFWESWITIALARILEPGFFCVDVGANQGYYTLLMADAVGPTGRVLAVEPNARLTGFLTKSLQVNGFQQRVTVLAKALFNTPSGSMTLVVPPNQPLNATIRREPSPSDETIEVEVTTMDDAVAAWPRVDVMKIDAEGAEEGIFQGMRKTIERSPGLTIVMEVNPVRYEDPSGFIASIRSAGFPLRKVDYDGSIQPISEKEILDSPDDSMLYLRRS